jgi:A/G-specific adenine glycosylase
MNTESSRKFRKAVLAHHAAHGRHDLPWRLTRDPYQILVSEIMLQQTQVSRVMNKWAEFLEKFPTLESLASAPTPALLSVWKGLGYNRRALNLRRAAEAIMRDHGGKFPRDAKALESLPGIGQSTRGAVMAFAFGIATPFIETNIRAVYIHHFFGGKMRAAGARDTAKEPDAPGVTDRELAPLIEKTLDHADPRTWYYALMDYGVHLKATLPNPSRKSAHHAKQSPFRGSNRQLRSHVLEFVMKGPRRRQDIVEHFATLGKEASQTDRNIRDLEKEGFLSIKRNVVSITY